ncbi:MAG: fibrillarin-like rRNA/tRNA 2'-O-methyltransferase [Methanobacteriota archaeon]|nr:MAG: fibrillarin-like rRNA/tRNA 2'-O-methyltransferase [Euryarchaeota archaeon]
MEKIVPHELPHVYTDGRTLYTHNLVPGQSVYGEKLVPHIDIEYRAWNPKRSKLAAFILKGCGTFPFEKNSKVLYLGAATGTTASHISDIVTEGMVYCVELSPIPFRKLVPLCETRADMTPLLADANNPEGYEQLVGEVDVVYQDIAQRNQVEIFVKNLRFLKDRGTAYLMVKARSIDVAKDPEEVYDSVKEQIIGGGLNVIESSDLLPYEKDHMAIVGVAMSSDAIVH